MEDDLAGRFYWVKRDRIAAVLYVCYDGTVHVDLDELACIHPNLATIYYAIVGWCAATRVPCVLHSAGTTRNVSVDRTEENRDGD
jgi:hypothetical protein